MQSYSPEHTDDLKDSWFQVGQVSVSGLKELLADTRELSERPNGQIGDPEIDISDEKFKSIRWAPVPVTIVRFGSYTGGNPTKHLDQAESIIIMNAIAAYAIISLIICLLLET